MEIPSRFSRRSTLAALFLAGAVALAAALPQGERPPDGLLYPRTIVLVRHAEKAADDPRDPSLTEEGTARAERLAALFAASGVSHVYATEFARTQATVAPLAKAVGANVQIVSARDGRALLSALDSLPRGSVAVVAGHSNTVPALVAALAPHARVVREDPDSLKIDEATYDRLFVVTQWAPEQGASVIELRF